MKYGNNILVSGVLPDTCKNLLSERYIVMIKLKIFFIISAYVFLMGATGVKASEKTIAKENNEKDANMVFLIKNGSPISKIVIPENADYWTVKVAAEYLREYIEKATDAKLEIVSEPDISEGIIISVGHTKLAQRAGINTDDLQLDGCKMIVKNKILFLIGRDGNDNRYDTARGSCRAVVTFLEKFLGVRWFIPSSEGELVPKTKNIYIPNNLEQTITSDFTFMLHGPYPPDSPAYIANNSCVKIKMWDRGGHSYPYFVPVEKYFQNHPEYFAVVSGKRSNDKLTFLCLSNPDVRKILLNETKKRLDDGYEWVQLGQGDGFERGVCECSECQKLDSYRGDNSLESLKEKPCERVLMLHKDIADECKKSYPDRKIHMLLYGPTFIPSNHFDKFPDNVVGEICAVNFDKFKEVHEAWKDKISRFTAYLYWESACIIPTGILPEITPSSVTEWLRYMHENKMTGSYFCFHLGKNWGLWGPVYYTASKLVADSNVSPDPAVKEYCLGVYGESGIIMKIFFDTLYSRIDSIKLDSTLEAKEMILLYYPPHFVQQLDGILKQAEQMAKTEKTKYWLKLTRDNFDYIKTISNMLTAYREYQANKTMSNLLELKNQVDEFEKYRQRIFSYADNKDYLKKWFPRYQYLTEFLSGTEQDQPLKATAKDIKGVPIGYAYCSIGAPITWNFDKMIKEFSKEKLEKKISAPWVAKPPTIDGNLAEAEWTIAKPQALMEWTGGEAKALTYVRTVYTDENLYVSFECQEPDIEKLKIKKVTRDSGIWNLDCVEVLFDIENSYKKYMHLIAAPENGSFYDARAGYIKEVLDPLFGGEDTGWNPDWDYAFKIDKEKKIWIIEMAIPFKSLGTEMPSSGIAWRINFGRERCPGNGGLFLWSSSENGNFTDPLAFGQICFSKK